MRRPPARASSRLTSARKAVIVGAADEPKEECTIGGCSAEDGGGRNLFIPRNCHLPSPSPPLRRLLLILGGGGERAEQWPEIGGSLQFIRRRYCSPWFQQPRDRDRCAAAAGPYCALARAIEPKQIAVGAALAGWQIIMSDTRTHAQTPTQ